MKNYRVLILFSVLLGSTLACGAGGAEAPVGQVTAAPTTVAVTPPGGQPTAIPTNAVAQATAIPTSSSGPYRISFAAGAVSATVTGTLNAGVDSSYVVYLINAGKDQTMTVTASANGGTVGLGVLTPNNTVLQAPGDGLAAWSGVLPETGDYVLTLNLLTGSSLGYTLQVVIPPLDQSGSANQQCWVTTTQGQTAYRESWLKADVFGTASAGDQTLALARTNDGWIGFDPGVAQAGNVGRTRLRWYAPGTSLTFDPANCQNNLPLVLSMQTLQNWTYLVMGSHMPVTLVDGHYGDPNFNPVDVGTKVAEERIDNVYAFGDLNGDGMEDAVLVFVTNTGGTGRFFEMIPVLNVNGNPQPGGSQWVGDRTPVTSLSIDSGTVTAVVTITPPSTQETWLVKLVNGALVKQ